MNLKQALFLVLAGCVGVVAHFHLPETPVPVPAPAPSVSFFTWDARPPVSPPVPLLLPEKPAPAPVEPAPQVAEAPTVHLSPAHDCDQVARRAGAIFNLHFVGIPFRPPEETLERHLLQEIAHSRFSSRDQAASFILQLCASDPTAPLPLWPHLPPGALKDDVPITNVAIQ